MSYIYDVFVLTYKSSPLKFSYGQIGNEIVLRSTFVHPVQKVNCIQRSKIVYYRIKFMTFYKQLTSILALGPIMVLALALVLQPKIVLAASDSGGSDTSSKVVKDKNRAGKKKKSLFAIKCFRGKIWSKEERKCVKEEKSSSLDQDLIYFQGRDLANDGQFSDAIRVLAMAPDQEDARVLNYLGFSNRKLGKMDKALGFYHAAIAANPDYTLVREYLGEAFIQLGQLEKAREQLTQLERICGGKSCNEYSMLSKVIIESQI